MVLLRVAANAALLRISALAWHLAKSAGLLRVARLAGLRISSLARNGVRIGPLA